MDWTGVLPTDINVEDQRGSNSLEGFLQLLGVLPSFSVDLVKDIATKKGYRKPPPIRDLDGRVYDNLSDYLMRNPSRVRVPIGRGN